TLREEPYGHGDEGEKHRQEQRIRRIRRREDQREGFDYETGAGEAEKDTEKLRQVARTEDEARAKQRGDAVERHQGSAPEGIRLEQQERERVALIGRERLQIRGVSQHERHGQVEQLADGEGRRRDESEARGQQ